MIKAIFLDFDNTVFSHNTNTIPESTKKAIKMLNEKGVLSFLATGRCKKEMSTFDISDLDVTGLILSNGQLVITKDEKVIYDEPIRSPLKDSLISLFNEKKMPVYLVTYDDIYISFVNDKARKTQELAASAMPPVKEYNGEEIYMATAFFGNEEDIEYVYSLGGGVTYWQEGSLDIVQKGSCKSKGIDEILKIYGIDISETMAFVDGENDIDMLKHCSIGVAMGNSKDIVKEEADYITDDIDEDGLYKALVHFNVL